MLRLRATRRGQHCRKQFIIGTRTDTAKKAPEAQKPDDATTLADATPEADRVRNTVEPVHNKGSRVCKPDEPADNRADAQPVRELPERKDIQNAPELAW